MSLVSDIIKRGTRGAQPAATAVGAGTLYYVTDELKTERSDGTNWQTYSSATGLSGALGGTDNALLRADGTGGVTAQGSAITVSDAGAITFPDGVRQTFNPDGTNAGLNTGSQAGNPSAPSDGDLWYNSTTSSLMARRNGVSTALGFSGAMVKKSADQTGANYTAATAVAFDAEVYDTDTYHDNVTNNTRLTVPVDGYYIVGASIASTNVTFSVEAAFVIRKGGSASFDGAAAIAYEVASANFQPFASLSTGPVSCTAGEYFEIYLNVSTDTSIDITAARTNFWIMRVG